MDPKTIHKVAVARLRTKDGSKYLLQRRNHKTNLFPGGLGFFGGHIEEDESPEDCIRRELEEETSLDLGEISLEPTVAMAVLPERTGGEHIVEIHVFDALVHDAGFDVNEDAQLELHTMEEALAQPDLIPTTRYVMENIKE